MMALFRRFDLSARPLLLLCGAKGSGKATLLAKSGLACEYLHPAGSSISKREMPLWFFAENAVYVSETGGVGEVASDAGGADQAGSGGKKKKKRPKKHDVPMSRLEAFYTELKKNRLWRKRAIDGALMIADIDDIVNADEARIVKAAAELREMADAVVSMTGYRIPVYLIFSKSDKIAGFREFFSDRDVVAQMPYMGSLVFGDGLSKLSPKELFTSYYKKIYNDLAALSVQGAVNARRRELLEKQADALAKKMDIVGERAAVCRLPQEMLLAESKLSAFVAAFFGDRGRNRPLFGGFFFTSSMMEKVGEPDKPAVFSNRALLDDVIPSAKHNIREAGEGTLFHYIKKFCVRSFIILLWVIAGVLIPGSALRDTLHIRALTKELSALEAGSALEDQYAALSALRKSYEFLQGRYMPPGRLVFGTGKAGAAIMDVYFAASRELLINPAAARLEASILRRAERGGEPATEEHRALYRLLEAYLLLTGGYPSNAPPFDMAAAVDVVERSLKMSLGQHYKSLNPKILQDDISAAVKLAAAGLLAAPQNETVVAAAREKLGHIPRAETVYAATVESLRSSHPAVPMNRIFGRTEIINHGRDVSALYTREGWERAVLPAIMDAAKDPFKNNWVTGPARVAVDEEKMFSELVTLYSADLRGRWLGFIRFASINLPSDLTAFAGDLEKLSLQKSEVGRTLVVACSLATQAPLPPDTSAKKTSLADIKAQAADLASKVRGAQPDFTINMPDPFEEAKKTFGPIDEFMTGDGFLKYRNDLSGLSKIITECAVRGGFGAAFTVRGENPIAQSRRNLAGAYPGMSDEVTHIMKRLLEAPLDHAATVLTKAVSAELEEAWSSEAVRYFNDRLGGRYPFNKTAPDVPYSDFEEFFKPQSGILWKHIEKTLAGLIERTPKGWAAIPSPALPVFVSDEALHCINRADRISAAFFRNDGSASQQDITFLPFTSSFGSAVFAIGQKTFEFSGGLPVTLNRSTSASETVVLRITAAGKDAGELRFAGEWSLARLFGAAKIDVIARSRYRARWSVNVQNIYTAHVTTTVQSNAAALFDETIIGGFDVPAKVLKK